MRYILFVLLNVLATFCFACDESTGRSCFILNNQSPYPVEIKCLHPDFGDNYHFDVSAKALSVGNAQYDISLYDSSGSPGWGTMSCELIVNKKHYPFSFHNPYWGPVGRYTLDETAKFLTIVLTDSYFREAPKKPLYSFYFP